MNRRTFIRRMLYSTVSLLGLSGGGYYYARYIEPFLLNQTHIPIYSKRLPLQFKNFRIVQFSDTHLGFNYTLKDLEKLIIRINDLKPDLIVFTGDLIDDPTQFNSDKELSAILKRLKSKHGKFWIYGNHDHGGYGTNAIKRIMEQSDFKLLKNSHEVIKRADDQIILAGIDDLILGKPDLATTLVGTSENDFKILLAHEPDFADRTRNFSVDVQLSGHSHGGQIRLPFFGSVYTPDYAIKYIKGSYTFDNERLFLYVNSGIGTTRLPFRFLCKPEITIFTLNDENNS